MASTEIRNPPPGYMELAPGIRCRCPNLWTDGKGSYWCCKSTPAMHTPPIQEKIDHPAHYGGKDDPYEAIKVIEAWRLNFNLGNTVKYISRFDKKMNALEDLKKARWYLDRQIKTMEAKEMARLALDMQKLEIDAKHKAVDG